MQLAFADWANLDGEFYPTYREIAEKARITKPGAIGIVQAMLDEGEIELLQHGGSGRGSKNLYRFAEKYRAAVRELAEKWASKRAKRVKQDDPLRVNENDPSTPERVNEDDPSRVKLDDPLEAKRVNENEKKGKRGIAHVRNNPSCIPSEEKPSIKKSNVRSTALSGPVSEVFDFWKTTLNHPRSILDDKRRKLIHARLDEGFSVEDLQTAITGCSRSPWHMGGNDRDQVYDDIALICRDAAHVEKFMAFAIRSDRRTLAAFSPAAQQTIAAATEWLQQTEGQGQ